MNNAVIFISHRSLQPDKSRIFISITHLRSEVSFVCLHNAAAVSDKYKLALEQDSRNAAHDRECITPPRQLFSSSEAK